MIVPGRDVASVNGSTNFVDGKYYHFYDFGLTNDSPKLYGELLSGAKSSIRIWDPHYRYVDFGLFSYIHQDGVSIEFLTICQEGEGKSDMNAFANEVLDTIDDEDVPVCKVRVYSLMPKFFRKGVWTEWHDRFLIVDDTDVYLIGASLDAHMGTNKSYGIYQLNETDDKNLVLDTYKVYRDSIKDTGGGAMGNGYKCYVHRP